MISFVEKLGKNLRESQWENCEKVSTFLTKSNGYFRVLWEMFGFTRSFGMIYTCVSTENLFGLTDVEGVDLHIYT